MTNSLARDELGKLLSGGIHSRSELIHFIVEIRKFLESRGLDEKYRALAFYCDWAMHAKMDRAGAQHVLQSIDETFKAKSYSAFVGDGGPKLAIASNYLRQEQMRDDLLEVLRILDLPTRTCETEGHWTAFLDLYSAAIAQSPLVVRAGSQTEYVESVVASVLREPFPSELEFDGDEAKPAFVVLWRITLKKPHIGQMEKHWYMFFWRH